MKNLNSARAVFFISQILYQSADYSWSYNKNDSPGQSKYFSLFDYLSFEVSTMIIWVLLAVGLYGLFEFFIQKKPSYCLELTQYISLPICYLLLPIHPNPAPSPSTLSNPTPFPLTPQFILLRIAPVLTITAITYVKLLFIRQFYKELQYNQFIKIDGHYGLFCVVRIVGLVVLAGVVDAAVMQYFLVGLQVVSTCYKYFSIIYCFPETQWCSIVTQLYGWLSILQHILTHSNIPNPLPFPLAPLLLLLLYLNPIPHTILILQQKLTRLLQQQRKQRYQQYYVNLLLYYVCVEVRSKDRFLQGVWSSRWRTWLAIRVGDWEYRIEGLLGDLWAESNRRRKEKGRGGTRMRSNIVGISNKQMNNVQVQVKMMINTLNFLSMQQQQSLKPTISRLKPQRNPSSTQINICVSDPQPETQNFSQPSYILPRIQKYLTSKNLLQLSNRYQFQTVHLLCYLLLLIPTFNPLTVYELYYHLYLQQTQKSNIFSTNSIHILWQLIKHTTTQQTKQYFGTHIENILKYQSLYALLQAHVTNEKKFYAMSEGGDLCLGRYRQYLEQRMRGRRDLQDCLGVLGFLYPNCESLAMKRYIVERFVGNNEWMSEQALISRMNKITAKKTKIINFSQNITDKQDCIFLINFLTNNGLISYYNKPFQKHLQIPQTPGTTILKLKDILPAHWRQQHETKLQQMYHISDGYQHQEDKIYYVEGLESHRYMEVTELKILPYFQLESGMYFLGRMKVFGGKELLICEKGKAITNGRDIKDEKSRRGRNRPTLLEVNPNTINKIINPKKGVDIQEQQDQNQKFIKNNIEQNQQLLKQSGKQGQINAQKPRSRHHIAFKHEILSDQQHNTIEQQQKTVQIFGKQYCVYTRTKCQNFYTKNLLQQKQNSIDNQFLKEELDAMIKFVLTKQNLECEVFEKSKKKANILGRFMCWVSWFFAGFIILMVTTVLGIGESLRIQNALISKSILVQLNYRNTFLRTVSFQNIILTLTRKYFTCPIQLNNLPSSHMSQYKALILLDSQSISNNYNEYIQIVYDLVKQKSSYDSISYLYMTKDFDLEYKNNSIIQHMTKFNTMIDSSNQILLASISNTAPNTSSDLITQSWILEHFTSILTNLNYLYQTDNSENPVYIENRIIYIAKSIVSNKIYYSIFIFWFCIGGSVVIIAAIYWIYIKAVWDMQKILCKPLLMGDEDRRIFRANYKAVQEYLSQEKQEVQAKQQYETNFVISSRNVMRLSSMRNAKKFNSKIQLPSMRSDKNGHNKRKNQNLEQPKTTKQQFWDVIPFVIITIILLTVVMFLCGNYLFLAGSQHIAKQSRQLLAYKKFISLNNKILNMYHTTLQYAIFRSNNPEISPQLERQSKESFLDEVQRYKDYIFDVDIPTLLNQCLFDNTTALVNQVLFGDPCRWSKTCGAVGIKFRAYPIQLNLFLSNFYKLQSLLLSEQQTPSSASLQLLIWQTYLSIRSLAQLTNHITQINHLQIANKKIYKINLITLTYAVLFVLIVVIVVHLGWLGYTGSKFGREVLSVLPSSAVCERRVFAYEVNCVVYRTGFGRDLGYY